MKLLNAKSFMTAVAMMFSFAVQAEERVVATVDGYPILQSQVKKALGKKANTEANRKAALDSVIDEYLVQRAIDQSGVKTNYAKVDQAIENIAVQNGITYGQLLDYLDSQNITLNQYRQQIAHQMVMEQVRHQSIEKLLRVEPQEVQALAKKMIADDKAANQYKTVMGTEYRISHILLKTNPILTDAKAKAKLNAILGEINTGKISFEKAARIHSVDYVSGADSGDLGWNFLAVYDPAFAAMAKKMKKGQLSAPFKSQFGWHILKVTNTRQGDRTEDDYLQKAYKQLIGKQLDQASKDWVKALKDQVEIRYIN